MFNKSLLVSIALIGLNSTQATQVPHAAPPTGECPLGSEKAWIITEGGHRYMLLANGTRINLDHPGRGGPGGHSNEEMSEEDRRNLSRNPLLTPAEEKEMEELKSKSSRHMYRRNGQLEQGLEYEGDVLPKGVYFKTESGKKGYKSGLWVLDPTIKPLGEAGKKIPTVARPRRAAPPLPSAPIKEFKKQVAKPDEVGLTVRTNLLQRNPQTGVIEAQRGAVNRAQTGITHKPEPHIDTSEKRPAVPSPSEEAKAAKAAAATTQAPSPAPASVAAPASAPAPAPATAEAGAPPPPPPPAPPIANLKMGTSSGNN